MTPPQQDQAAATPAASAEAPVDDTTPDGGPSGEQTIEGDPVAEVAMAEGLIKWYSLAKGFGFAAVDDARGDIFIHHTLLDEREDLLEGDRVRVWFKESPKGLQATRLERI